MKNIIKAGLLILAFFLSFLVYKEIMAPIHFNKVKQERYTLGIDRLMRIRDAQVAYREANKKYASTFDSLIPFIDTGRIAIIKRVDTSFYYTDPNSGVSGYKDIVLRDTIGFVNVKDSIFKNADYKNLGVLEINGKSQAIELDADVEVIPDSVKDLFDPEPRFKASIKKRQLLDGESENDILVSINKPGEIEGKTISVGNLRKVSTDGNWTKEYEKAVKDLREKQAKK